MRIIITKIILSLISILMLTNSAMADLLLCNRTNSRVSIAIGYNGPKGWTSEGWWNIKSNECEILLKGSLNSRFYYIYGIDIENGGTWEGRSFMCIEDKIFTVFGVDRCEERSYKRSGFFEVDTKDEIDWTINLANQ